MRHVRSYLGTGLRIEARATCQRLYFYARHRDEPRATLPAVDQTDDACQTSGWRPNAMSRKRLSCRMPAPHQKGCNPACGTSILCLRDFAGKATRSHGEISRNLASTRSLASSRDDAAGIYRVALVIEDAALVQGRVYPPAFSFSMTGAGRLQQRLHFRTFAQSLRHFVL